MVGRAQATFRQQTLNPFIGSSTAILTLEERSRLAAAADSPVLILGEAATGKNELARWIHRHSSRGSEPMLELNCKEFPKELLEIKLFGHQEGEAVDAELSALEATQHGTVILDEIGYLDWQLQLKLLKVLEEKRIRRRDEIRDRRVDFRLIATSHQQLDRFVQEQRFRLDLFYHISAFQLVLPPLRQRLEDIPYFAQWILDRLLSERGQAPVHLTRSALSKLQQHTWPGNFREFRTVLEQALTKVKPAEIHALDLEFTANPQSQLQEGHSNLTLKELERHCILQVLGEEGGRVDSAARRLDIPRSTLYQKLKTYVDK